MGGKGLGEQNDGLQGELAGTRLSGFPPGKSQAGTAHMRVELREVLT